MDNITAMHNSTRRVLWYTNLLVIKLIVCKGGDVGIQSDTAKIDTTNSF